MSKVLSVAVRLAAVVQLKAAVAGKAFALRRIDHEVAVAAHRQVERIAGLIDRPLADIAPGGDVAHEGEFLAQNAFAAAVADQVVDEHHLLGLEARCVHVGDVVGDDAHLPPQGGLARQCDN